MLYYIREVENAGFAYGDLKGYSARYDIHALKEGWNTLDDGEEIFYISNPAPGLWAMRDKFTNSQEELLYKLNKSQKARAALQNRRNES